MPGTANAGSTTSERSDPRKPYVSFVTTARNDDHGNDALRRTQIFIRSLLRQCERFELPAELVIVEWNPPADRPPLGDVLDWPVTGGHCDVRIVRVPSELHRRLEHADRLPLFQMIAKNVGIRRARGEFVVATNIDVLMSDGLMAFFAARRLRSGFVYRVNRHDIPSEIDDRASIEKQLAYCSDNVIRVNRRHGTLILQTREFFRIYPEPRLLAVLRNSRAKLWLAHRFGRLRARLLWGDIVGRARYSRLFAWRERTPVRLHTNASGDLTLMSRDDWLRTRGYAELEVHAMRIDALQLYQAHYRGIRERFLPFPAYHIEHPGGHRVEAEPGDSLSTGLANRGIPELTQSQFVSWVDEMQATGAPLEFNRDDWGFANEQLEETVVYDRRGPPPTERRLETAKVSTARP